MIVAIFLCRAVAGAVIVPPWQGPDEPSHFVLAVLLAGGRGDTPATRAPLERDVLRSMAGHGWWKYYQKPTPDPLPDAFADVPEHLATGTLLQPGYYYLAAAVLRATPGDDVAGNYEVLRVLSVLLSVAALVFAWAGTSNMLGTATAAGALAILALHPQFLLASLSVGPDALINVCGALMWWQSARLLRARGWRWLLAAVSIGIVALAAALSKRNGIPLLAVALLAVTAAFASGPGRAYKRAVWAAAAGIAYAVAAIVSLVWERIPLLTFWSYALVPGRTLSDVDVEGVWRFLVSALQSAWLTAGWSRFPAPFWWYVAAGFLTVAGIIGAAVATWRTAGTRPLWMPWLFAIVHIGAVLVIAFVGYAAPQGRYVMPVAPAAAVLLWIGLTHWSPAALRGWVQAVVVAIMAVLDLAGFALVLMPQYR